MHMVQIGPRVIEREELEAACKAMGLELVYQERSHLPCYFHALPTDSRTLSGQTVCGLREVQIQFCSTAPNGMTCPDCLVLLGEAERQRLEAEAEWWGFD